MALDVGKAEIEDDQRRMLRQLLQRGLAVGGLDHLVALRAQSHAQQFADRRLVVDAKDLYRRGGHAAVSSARAVAGTGRRVVSTAPRLSRRVAAERVPWM